jgi:nucleotide-binding universal stress UspA family protein
METARLLVCVDGSRASLEAARLAIDLARRWNSHLRIVYVVERSELDGAADPDVATRLRQSGQAILARILSMAAAQGVTAEQAMLEGVPFDVILDDARSWKADVIIMGRTGRTGPGRALLGSEAERVLEFSDRPVLIVPTIESHVSDPPPSV